MKHSRLLGKIVLSITFGFVWIISNFITFHYVCDYPEYGPSFYGFPFVQQTNSTWVNSFSGNLYLSGMMGNLIIWSLVFYMLLSLINDVLGRKIKKALFLLGLLGFVTSIIYISFYFEAYDWRIQWSHDNFKIDYFSDTIQCKRTFYFFKH